MSIQSEPSKGTGFIIKLPVSLSIIYTITFKIGNYTLSIPTSNVESVARMEHISPEDSTSFYDLRGLLGIDNNEGECFHILKLKDHATIALAVDSIIGNKPLVVMPVGELLAKAKLFAGVGIMENGDISILLDIENLTEVQTSSPRVEKI